jgi:hypothetical protein
METYLQCPSCGAPNNSKHKCEYCKAVFTLVDQPNYSKSDKSKFDLAIYELREGRLNEAKKLFDSITDATN